MGNTSQTLVAFWRLMKGQITEEEFLTTLQLEGGAQVGDNPKQRMVTFLCSNLDHFSPHCVQDHTSEQASSRVEGFFGAYKNMTHHEIGPLATTAKGIRLLARMALKRRDSANIPALPPEIMSMRDHQKMGSFAAVTILQEFERLGNGGIDRVPESYPKCCTVARVHHLPCVHRLLSRANRMPRLRISDIHPCWQCQDLRKDVQASHGTADLDTSQRRQDQSPSQWTFSQLVARFEPFFSVAERSSQCQAIVNDALQRLNSL